MFGSCCKAGTARQLIKTDLSAAGSAHPNITF